MAMIDSRETIQVFQKQDMGIKDLRRQMDNMTDLDGNKGQKNRKMLRKNVNGTCNGCSEPIGERK